MKIIVLGGSGMLGQALIPEGETRGHTIFTPTRDDVNITDDSQLEEFIRGIRPDMVINAAALINHTECEENPRTAYMMNARPVATLANICRELVIDLVQISSDQCAYPLLNEYAKTKAAGECFALSYENALVVRTNIVGPKNTEWAFRVIENDEPCTLYTNYRVSSIDVWSFSKALFDVIEVPSYDGIINIASQDSFTKATFIKALADKLGRPLTQATLGEMAGRHQDLTLDVSKVEAWLGYELPIMNDVIDALIERRNANADRSRVA